MSVHDSTTMIVRRRLRHIKTTIAGIASMVCPIVSLFLPPDLASKVLAAATILAGIGLISAADAKPQTSTLPLSAPLPLLALLALVTAAGAGCSTFESTQTETDTDRNFVRETTIHARTFFNARSDLAKLRATTTDKTQGMTLGALGMAADGSNVTVLVEAVVGAAIRAAAGK